MKKNRSNLVALKDLMLTEILSKDISTSKVFYSNGIQFYCNPNQTLFEAVSEKNLSLDEISSQLELIFQNYVEENDLTKKDLVSLSRYITDKHHTYVRKALPEINQLKVHIKSPNLNMLLDQLTKEMETHIQKEERVVFPLIKYLFDTERFNEKPKSRNYGTVQNPIKQMLAEHDVSIDLVNKIKSVLHKIFNYPAEKSGEKFITLINEFEEDLFTHIHLENNVLFPKTINLENKLTNTIRR